MKKIILYMVASLFIAGCKKNDWGKDIQTTITPVTATAPDNNLSIALDPLSNAVVTFEWQAAKTADYTLVFYKLLFATETGSFANPVYIGTPASLGAKTTLSLTHRDLNKIASKAGIKALEKGKIKWAVVASNGIVSDTLAQPRYMELQRPAGFAENPVDLFVYGTATEAGTDINKAIRFKKLSDGVFELYTSFTAGTYKLVDKTSGTPAVFVLDGALIKDAAAEANSPAGTKTVYRINLDFNTATARLTEIQSVGLWFAGYNSITNQLTYDANGVWKAADIAIVWSNQSWGKDERYKFRAVEKDMSGNLKNVYWSSVNKDNSRATSSSPASYYFFKSNDTSQWDYTFKFEKEAAKADVLVKFQSISDYTHQVIYK
jgi:hypothetical protein